jgi:hypothetical protein
MKSFKIALEINYSSLKPQSSAMNKNHMWSWATEAHFVPSHVYFSYGFLVAGNGPSYITSHPIYAP